MSRANKSHDYSQLMSMTDPDNSTLNRARGVQQFDNGSKWTQHVNVLYCDAISDLHSIDRKIESRDNIHMM